MHVNREQQLCGASALHGLGWERHVVLEKLVRVRSNRAHCARASANVATRPRLELARPLAHASCASRTR
eukprot:6193568-Pleurochrysis_carterae.AAC.2